MATASASKRWQTTVSWCGQPVPCPGGRQPRRAEVTVKQVTSLDSMPGAPCMLPEVVAGARGRGGAPAPLAAPVSTLRKDQAGRCDPTLTVPAAARTTEPYWHREGEAGRYTFDADAPFGLPYRPTPFYVQVTLTFAGGDEVINGLPVQYRYQGDMFSGKAIRLLVVPALSVRVSPRVSFCRGLPAVGSGPERGTRPALLWRQGAAPGRARCPPAGRVRPPLQPSR